VQATAERTPLSRAHLDELLALAASGITQLRTVQEQALGEACLRRPIRRAIALPVRIVTQHLLLATHNEHSGGSSPACLLTAVKGRAGRSRRCRQR